MRNLTELEEEFEEAAFPDVTDVASPPPSLAPAGPTRGGGSAGTSTRALGLASLVAAMRRSSDGPPAPAAAAARPTAPSVRPPIVVAEDTGSDDGGGGSLFAPS